MSTKIYQGLISSFDLIKTHQLLKELKPEMGRIALQETHAWMAREASTMLDRMAMSDRAITRIVEQQMKVYREVRDKLDKAHEKIKKRHRMPGIDFDSEVILFPHEDRTLMLPIIESRTQSDLLLSQPWCSEYGYWDNTDAPEHISEEEFKKRGDVWDKALGETGVLSENGLIYQLSTNFDVQIRICLQGIVDSMPSKEERIKTYVDNEIMNQAVRRVNTGSGDEEALKKSTGIFEMLKEARALTKTDEFVAKREDLEKEAEKRFRVYKIEDLIGPGNQ